MLTLYVLVKFYKVHVCMKVNLDLTSPIPPVALRETSRITTPFPKYRVELTITLLTR